jgi:hypothetical protein
MDKHTRRYMVECFGVEAEEVDFFDLANCLNKADSEDDFIYLSHAMQDIEDETERKVLKEQMLKKQLGWD